MNSPFVLEISASSAPKTTIRTYGATMVVTALVQVMALPPAQPAIELSSMTMVGPYLQHPPSTHKHVQN